MPNNSAEFSLGIQVCVRDTVTVYPKSKFLRWTCWLVIYCWFWLAMLFLGMLAALIGASPGMTGTARGQSQLRQAFVFTNTYAMTQPEVLVARAHEKFDDSGKLTDESTRVHLKTFLERFATWVAIFVKR